MNKNRPRLNDRQLKHVKQLKGQGGAKAYLLIGCVHAPFHNRHIMQGIYDLMEAKTFDGIIIGGDFLDMGALSVYEKGKVNKSGVTLAQEYSAGRVILHNLSDRLPKGAKKVFMYGNHEHRYWRWLADIDNSKYGDLISPNKGLLLEETGWEIYDQYKKDQYKLSSLHIFHGDFWNIHVAKKTLDTWKRNVIFWHTHRTQMYREGDFCAYNLGFLGDIDSVAFDYAPRSQKNKWVNGFGIVHVIGENHYVDMVNCIRDTFTYNGVQYGKK